MREGVGAERAGVVRVAVEPGALMIVCRREQVHLRAHPEVATEGPEQARRELPLVWSHLDSTQTVAGHVENAR